MPSLRSVLPYSALLVLLLSSSSVHGYAPGKVGGTGPASSSPKAQPGFCVVPADCKVEGYECVALQTTRPGTEDVKQCLPKKQDTDVCAGQFPGLCPSFASWADPYKQISSVCTYKPAKKCALDPTGESVKGEVVCVPGAKDDNGKELSVIYGCVDIDITAKKVGFTDREDAGKLAKTLGTADAVITSCLNTNASATATNVLCSGHGTCLMKNAGTIKYECRCNIGYSGDFCDKKDSNKCALPGQCSAGQCNLEKQVCECPAGTTGNQCADCDASSPNACNGNGKCTNKQCVCDSGFLGDHCDQKPKPKPTATSAASSSNSTSGGSAVGANATAGNAAAPRAGSLAASGMAAVVVVLIAALH